MSLITAHEFARLLLAGPDLPILVESHFLPCCYFQPMADIDCRGRALVVRQQPSAEPVYPLSLPEPEAVPFGEPIPSPDTFVFLDDRGLPVPFLVHNNWLYSWIESKKEWVSMRELKPGEMAAFKARAIPPDQAALYGVPSPGERGAA